MSWQLCGLYLAPLILCCLFLRTQAHCAKAALHAKEANLVPRTWYLIECLPRQTPPGERPRSVENFQRVSCASAHIVANNYHSYTVFSQATATGTDGGWSI